MPCRWVKLESCSYWRGIGDWTLPKLTAGRWAEVDAGTQRKVQLACQAMVNAKPCNGTNLTPQKDMNWDNSDSKCESAEDWDKFLIKAYLHWQSVSVIVDYSLSPQRQCFYPTAKVMANIYYWKRNPDRQVRKYHKRAYRHAIPHQWPSLAAGAIVLSTHLLPPWHRLCWGSIVETEKNKSFHLIFLCCRP